MAYLASLNVKTCTIRGRDECGKLKNGQGYGQNLYWTSYPGTLSPESIKNLILSSVYSWVRMYSYASEENIRRFGSPSKLFIEHFTQLAWANSGQIGCAVATYSGNPYTTALIACNYEGGNMGGQSVYEIGDPGSKCRTRDSKYTFLCTS